jgi:hypothetical protein
MRPALLLLAACAPAVPDEPSFQQHVAPILAANCVRCHGAPPIGGAPPGFRLDLFADAAAQAERIAIRADRGDMPPRFPLDDYQIDTLARWFELGAPRGAPNPGNRPPTASIVDGMIVVADPDGDVVGGTLRTSGVTLGPLRSGPNVLPAGFSLEAVLDDGALEVTVALP